MVPLRVPLLRRCPTPLYLLDDPEKGDRELAPRRQGSGSSPHSLSRMLCGPDPSTRATAPQATTAPRPPKLLDTYRADLTPRQEIQRIGNNWGRLIRGRRPSGLPVHEPARVRAGGLRTPRQRADTELHSAVVQVSEVVRRRDGASRRNQGPPSGGQVLDRRHGRALRRSGHLEDPQVWREGGSRALRE